MFDSYDLQIEMVLLDDRLKNGEFPIPEPATEGSAGFDLRAMIDADVVIAPGMTVLVPSGISVHIRNKHVCMLIIPRSGLGHRSGLVLGNGTGLCDSDFTGPVMVSLFNRGYNPVKISPGDRVAQAFFVPVIHPEFTIVPEFSVDTDRGAGGFGSTGS